MNLRFSAAFIAVSVALGAGSAAFAQQTPRSPAPAPSATPLERQAIDALGNIVKSAFGWNDTEAYGTVTYYRGYEMQVRMQLDRYREIHLHRGTVINPRGWTIKPGQVVDVRGRPQADGSLEADMIVVH